ncbi:acyltransferase family protein [Agrobacterium bohemicum]|nr:acyltransferase family protein [Agrobacterium bohemicum]
MKYRAEIDGLRAIAVLSVVLAHANFSVFGGGFLGVDVFFAISGYLITTVILDEYAKGTFSLLGFYERRARRILPALFFVLLCTVPAAWVWLLPDAYEDFSKSLMMATLSLSNIYFLKKTDYFAPDSAEVPLLHTWSLGVEEQFYILFPLLFLFRLKIRTIFRILLAAAIASLVVSEFGARHFPSANHYLLPTRVWEILAGSLCAFYVFGRPRRLNGPLALAGFVMVLVAVFLFDPTTRVPSFAALLPIGGTCAFFLFASSETWPGRLLSFSPLVWIGRISFSIYLWHQPVFAFWRIRSSEPPSQSAMCVLILVVLALAAFSWWFIEQPFRYKKIGTRKVAAVGAVCAFILVGFGTWGDLKDGLPFRLAPDVRNFIKETTWSEKCLFQVKDGIPAVPNEECMFDAKAGKTYAVWGDSIGASISPALLEALKLRHMGMIQLTHGFCAPIIGVSTARDEGAANCDTFNQRALAYLTQSNIDTVVLTASWVNFFNSPYLQIGDIEYSFTDTPVSAVAKSLRDTVLALEASGKRVVIVYPSPLFNKPVGEVMAGRIVKGDKTPDFGYSTADFKTNTARAYSVLDAAVPDNVKKVFPEQIFCNRSQEEMCFFGRDGVAYIADRGHYTKAGAAMIVDQLMNEMQNPKTQSPAGVEIN